VTVAAQAPQARLQFPRFRPITRSRTKRTEAAQQVKRHMVAYMAALANQSKAERAVDVPAVQAHRERALKELLWARAQIEQALWLETGGRMGDQYATPSRTIQTLPIRGASITDDTN